MAQKPQPPATLPADFRFPETLPADFDFGERTQIDVKQIVGQATRGANPQAPIPAELQGQPNIATKMWNSPLGAPARFVDSVSEDVLPALGGMAKMAAAYYDPVARTEVQQGFVSTLSSDAPWKEKLGALMGINVDDLKTRAASGDVAGVIGKAVVPIGSLAAGRATASPKTTNAQVSSVSSTLTQGAREAIPPVVKETLPALKAEARAAGVKVNSPQTFEQVANSLDGKLQARFESVKAGAQPTLANIDGAAIAADAMARLDKAFPYLKSVRPQIWHAISDRVHRHLAGADRKMQWSLDRLDGERRALNDEAASTWAAKEVTWDQAMKDPALAAEIHMADAVRDALYSTIQRRTGQDMQALKRQQSNLATLRRQLTILQTELPNKQAVSAGQPILEGLTDVRNLWDPVRQVAARKYLEPESRVRRRLTDGFKDPLRYPASYGVLPATSADDER